MLLINIRQLFKNSLWPAILVSALGYLVDVYDIVLFTAVRVPSLKALSITGDELTSIGLRLIQIQLLGMVVGGIIWGMIGDKRGRLSVLFGSIILYSSANLANAFVQGVQVYAVLRFIAGFGLAGELGAGVTLVSEMMSKENRGYGTMIIASSGVFGGIAGGLVGDLFSWRTAYFVGGAMGFVLLVLRAGVNESGLFTAIKRKEVEKGKLSMFIRSPQLFGRYLRCLFVGMPIWVLIGLFMTLAPEIGKAMNIQGEVSAGRAILLFNVGLGLGDLSSSLLSQRLKSRKSPAMIFLSLTAIFLGGYLSMRSASAELFYFMCALLGFGSGYWAIFIMIASEQFGTNLRATATTSIPNMVRGLAIPASLILASIKPHLGILRSLALISAASITAAFVSLYSLTETFATSLDFLEE